MKSSHRVAVLYALFLLASSALAQVPAAPGDPQPGPIGQAEAETLVTLNLEATPIAEAADQIGAVLDTIVLVGEGVEGDVTLNRPVPRNRVLVIAGLQVQAIAKPCLVLCTVEEKRGVQADPPTDPVAMNVTGEHPLSTIAQLLEATSGQTIRCTQAAAGLMASLPEGGEQTLGSVLESVTVSAKTAWVRGHIYQPLDEQAITAGLRFVAGVPEAQRLQAMQRGVETIYGEYYKLAPADRPAAVARFAANINRWSDRLAGLSPEVQGQIKTLIGPMIDLGVQRFVLLDAADQAIIMPAIQALKKLR